MNASMDFVTRDIDGWQVIMPLPDDPLLLDGMEGTGAANSAADAGMDSSAASGSGDPPCGGPPERHEECGDPTKESADAGNAGTRPKADQRMLGRGLRSAGCSSLWHSSSQPAPAPPQTPCWFARTLPPHPIYHSPLEALLPPRACRSMPRSRPSAG